MEKLRARHEDEKEARRLEILFAAENLMKLGQGELATASEIAKASGLAKGTIYLYFSSIEEIYLSLFEYHLNEIFALLGNVQIENLEDIPKKLIPGVAKRIAENSMCLKLASIHNHVLEPNSREEVVVRIRQKVIEDLKTHSRLITAFVPSISQLEAIRILQRAYGIIMGIWDLTVPHEKTKKLIKKTPSLKEMDMSFEEELTATLTLYWYGLVSSTRT